MFKFKIIFIELMLFVSLLFSSTNGSIEGRLKDKSTDENLFGATIQIVGTSIGTVSDNEGYYRIFNLRNGIYDVKFSLIGYKTVIMKNVDIHSDVRMRLDIVMEQSSVELGVVEISSQKPLIQKDQPSTTFSISNIKLEKLPIQTFQEVLSLQPGVTLEGNVRGGKTNEVIYLIDGIPVQDFVVGGLGTELPKSSIGGMTIYTGGFEAEYGNALSAVINVVTKGGDNTHRFAFRFEKDNWIPAKLNKQVDKHNSLELSASGPIIRSEVFYLTALTMTASNTRWWQDLDNFFASPNYKDVSGFSKIDYLFSSTTRITAQGIYSFREWRDYEFSWRYNLDGLPQRSKSSLRGSLILNQTLSNHSAYSLSLTSFYLHNKVGTGNKQDIELDPYQFDYYLRYIVDGKKNWWADAEQYMNTIKADFDMLAGTNHSIKTGFELNLYDINSDLIKYEPQRTYFGKTLENEPMLNYSNSYNYFPRTGSLFIQDKIRFELDGSTLSFGLRWDFLDPRAKRPIVEYIPTTKNEFQQQVKGYQTASLKHQLSPRIALAMPIGSDNIFYANFGKYFQYPLFDYLYAGIDPVRISNGAKSVLTGNPDLNPELTTSWELGYKQSFQETYVGSITYFRKNIKNQIDTKTLVPFDSKSAGDFGFAQYVNNAEADAEGIEFILSRERDEKFSGSISYTYMIAEGTSEVANQSINLAQWGFPIQATSFPLSWDQRHSIKIDLETKTLYDIVVNGILWYNSPKPYTLFPTRDGYTPVDPAKDFVPNNSRMKSILFANVKVSKEFIFDNLQDYSFMIYVDARNILNSKNIKWIDSNGRIGGELGDPSAYYDPRRIKVGCSVVF